MHTFSVKINNNIFVPAKTNCDPEYAYPADWDLDYDIENIELFDNTRISLDANFYLECYDEEIEVDYCDVSIIIDNGKCYFELTRETKYYEWIESISAEFARTGR